MVKWRRSQRLRQRIDSLFRRSAAPEQDPAPDGGPQARAAADLCDRFAAPVYQYVLFRTGAVHLAEAITEQVLLAAHPTDEPTQSNGLSMLRSMFGHAEELQRQLTGDSWSDSLRIRAGARASSVHETPDLGRLTGAMQVLSPRQVQVIVMRFGLRQELACIAAGLDLSEEAVRLLQVRALRTLAGHMLPSACPPGGCHANSVG